MQVMRFTEPGMSEHVVAAHFEYLCAREGSQRPAYVPVVASGYVLKTTLYGFSLKTPRTDRMDSSYVKSFQANLPLRRRSMLYLISVVLVSSITIAFCQNLFYFEDCGEEEYVARGSRASQVTLLRNT